MKNKALRDRRKGGDRTSKGELGDGREKGQQARQRNETRRGASR